MYKIVGALIVIIASVGVGYVMSDSLGTRLRSVEALARFVDHISVNIDMYKTPLCEIYDSFDDKYLASRGFTACLDRGIYAAAESAGLLRGDEEAELIKVFGEKIGGGGADDMVKLCSYTSSRLMSIADKLRKELPEKQKVYRTISVLAGISVVIMLV